MSTSLVSMFPFFGCHFLYIVNTGSGHSPAVQIGKSSIFKMNALSGNRSALAPLMAASMHAICACQTRCGDGLRAAARAFRAAACAAGGAPRAARPRGPSVSATSSARPLTIAAVAYYSSSRDCHILIVITHPPVVVLAPQPVHLDGAAAHHHKRRIALALAGENGAAAQQAASAEGRNSRRRGAAGARPRAPPPRPWD